VSARVLVLKKAFEKKRGGGGGGGGGGGVGGDSRPPGANNMSGSRCDAARAFAPIVSMTRVRVGEDESDHPADDFRKRFYQKVRPP